MHIAVFIVDVRLTTEHLLPHVLFSAFPHRSTSLGIHGHSDQETDLRQIDDVEVQRQAFRYARCDFASGMRKQTVNAIVEASLLIELVRDADTNNCSAFLIGTFEVDLAAN